MKIVVIGTRGIPNIQGGVETHCQELYPILAKKGLDITLVRRSCYISDNMTSFDGVKLKDIFAPRKKSIEAIVHTFLAILYAKKHKADIVHIHAIGPALLTPFARLLELKVVVTHHGADYDRQKWGKLAKLILKSGEKFAAKYANELIVISKGIQLSLKNSYNRQQHVNLIYNGVNTPTKSNSTEYIDSLNIKKSKYIFALGRFVEEKGFDGLIKAFKSLNNSDFKLVIAGDADHADKYSTYLKRLASENNVILTGFIKGDKLNELFTNAKLFVLPSFHEGLPISLLEAMSYNLDVLVSDIPANKEVGLPDNCYFKTGDWLNLTDKLNEKLDSSSKTEYNLCSYDWNYIASETIEVYKKLLSH